MSTRHPLPRQWLVIAPRTPDPLAAAARMPRGSGILIVDACLARADRVTLRRIARRRGLLVVEDDGDRVARVHSMRELRRAGSRRTKWIFLSPLFPTASHPGAAPLPLMRAATLARLAAVPVVALGGMRARRFARVHRLGFAGWAGIDAYAGKGRAVRRAPA
ncbi:thiamine phosphate synthase [Sphingomonas sabuli]|uniref:Thiamine phosphate synthase n=1 Tax=Sphingomonas sabuli TaxID=2764186 RepID=A0A7G9L0D7_9SPHN|nr:thiamine phosphate synthase [Sphingomonas sabuli]QNM82086.1 thiamine phosphate synthase [Sphingomonas sabuli]